MGASIQMITTFTYDYIDTDIFEKEYEVELREDHDTREDIIRYGLVVNMWLDDVLIGECFGITPRGFAHAINQCQGDCDDGDIIEDVDMTDNESVYVWSTTLLTQFRGVGYGSILRKEFSRYASNIGFAKLVGHATSPVIVQILKNVGAIFSKSAVHKNWYGTERTAYFYTQILPQTRDWNCGPTALAYLLEMNEHTYSISNLEISLHADPVNGTDPKYIKRFLEYKEIPLKAMEKELQPNSIIDITVEGDGHWIILIDEYEGNQGRWHVFDPWPGEGYKTLTTDYLEENWYSPKYGKYVGFTLL